MFDVSRLADQSFISLVYDYQKILYLAEGLFSLDFRYYIWCDLVVAGV